MAAVDAGLLNEWRATLLVKETACLSVEDRAAVDEELAPDTGTFEGAGDKAIIAAAKAAAYRRDPRSVTQRAARAANERTVSLRPAPDTMTILTALLPVAQGVAAYAALTRAAVSARSRPGGEQRGRGQVMADTLVEGITGSSAGYSGIDLQLVMTDRTLLANDSEPAQLTGYGVVPAQWAGTTPTPSIPWKSGRPPGKATAPKLLPCRATCVSRPVALELATPPQGKQLLHPPHEGKVPCPAW